MTKLGLISDIHGDIAHLHQTLTLLERHQVDQILCTGDLVHGEPYENEVITTIRERGIVCTMGNHDQETALEQRKPDSDARLTPENLAYLGALPLTHSFSELSIRVLMTHATPWNPNIHLFSFSHPPLLKQVVAASAADVIIIGHTHEPMQRYFDGTWIFNPGSLHQNRFVQGQTCAILSLPELTFSLYDINSSSGLPIESVCCRSG